MKHLILSLMLLVLGLPAAMAQEAIRERRPTGSPQFNDDGTVTFRLYAPEAQKVIITGDFVHNAEMAQEEGGVWTFTTPQPLPAELYFYRYYVDGAETLDPANMNRSRDVRSFMSTFIVSREQGDPGYLYAPQPVPHGNVSQVWYPSPKLGMQQRRMAVYTPAGYDKGGKYPVLYLLHGAGGDEEAWLTLGRTAQILDNLIAMGKAEPMIVVMPNGNANQEASPYWQASPMGQPQTGFPESFSDIMDYMKKHYRIRTGTKNTAICGLSMGGFHTFSITNLMPGTFHYIGLFSAAIRMGRSRQQQNDTFAYLEQHPDIPSQLQSVFAAKPALYWIAIGKDDFLMEHNVGLRRYLDQMNYPYEYYENSGGHIWRNWRLYLTSFAQRIFK